MHVNFIVSQDISILVFQRYPRVIGYNVICGVSLYSLINIKYVHISLFFGEENINNMPLVYRSIHINTGCIRYIQKNCKQSLFNKDDNIHK